MSVLTAAPNIGKVAWRDALVKEVCWLTGSNPEARIPPYLRRKPAQFFAMWEKLRSKAQTMIASKKDQQALFTMEANEGTLEPGMPEASGTSSGNDKFMLASLLVKDEVVKSKRILVPLTLSALKTSAISTFDLPENSTLAFEVLDAKTQDRWHNVSCCVCVTLCFWFVWFELIVLSNECLKMNGLR